MMKRRKDVIIPFKAICSVHSHSHKLNSDVFSLLMSGKTNIFVTEVKENSFLLFCVNEQVHCKTPERFALLAHLCFSTFIMALNIATLGYFTWNWGTFTAPLYKLIDPRKDGSTKMISLKILKDKANNTVDITKNDIRKAIMLYGALAREKESNARKEYIKGILHLSLDFADINFHREAFGNFYRAFENFATERVLRVRKLSNELKQLQKVITDLGFSNEIANEFRSLYQLRCNQIMHAQKKQVEIKIDDAISMKAILDAILYKVYQPIWQKEINNLRENSKSTGT